MPRQKKGTFEVKKFEAGETVVAMASIEGVLVIATNKGKIYATGNAAKIKNLFPEEKKSIVHETPPPVIEEPPQGGPPADPGG